MLQSIILWVRDVYLSWTKSYKIQAPTSDNPSEIVPEWLLEEVDAVLQEEARASRDRFAGKLYLVSFSVPLLSHEAETKLGKLGLQPANIAEVLMFLDNYHNSIKDLPIICLNCYHDYSKQFPEIFHSYKRKGIGLAVCITSDGVVRPGEVESSEASSGARFVARTQFLVKSF